MPSDDVEPVDRGHYWSIEQLDVDAETYLFSGRGGGPYGSKAVAKAKQQYAREHDADFGDLVAKKITEASPREGGAIVVVTKKPRRRAAEVLP